MRQGITEDFFLEMERCLRTVNKYQPSTISDLNNVRDILISKYQQGIIPNIIHFREVSKIARAQRLNVPSSESQSALLQLFTDNNYSIDDAYKDSAEWAYDERQLIVNVQWLIEHLNLHEKEIGSSTQIVNVLHTLRSYINKVMEE